MEALILSCGTGGGHDSAAKAVAEELTRRGSSATVLNLFTLENERTAELVNELYIQVVQAAPKLFGAAYKAGEAYRNLQVHSPVYWANGKFADALRGYLDEHHFDVIIATHMYPAQTLTNLKRQGVSIPPTVLVATDYTCIPFMEETDCDYCVIPSPELTGEFCSRGFPVERLLPYGIPVREAFSVNGTKSEARRRLGLEQDSQYILLAGGSMGAGSIVDAVKAVEGIIQMRPDCRAGPVRHEPPPVLHTGKTVRRQGADRAYRLYGQDAGLYACLRFVHHETGRAFLDGGRSLRRPAHTHIAHTRLRDAQRSVFLKQGHEYTGRRAQARPRLRAGEDVRQLFAGADGDGAEVLCVRQCRREAL